MLNFGYLYPGTCLLYDFNNKSIMMFLTFAGQSFNALSFCVLLAERLPARNLTKPRSSAGSIPVGRQFFCIACFKYRRSGGSSLGFQAGSL